MPATTPIHARPSHSAHTDCAGRQTRPNLQLHRQNFAVNATESQLIDAIYDGNGELTPLGEQLEVSQPAPCPLFCFESSELRSNFIMQTWREY